MKKDDWKEKNSYSLNHLLQMLLLKKNVLRIAGTDNIFKSISLLKNLLFWHEKISNISDESVGQPIQFDRPSSQ